MIGMVSTSMMRGSEMFEKILMVLNTVGLVLTHYLTMQVI